MSIRAQVKTFGRGLIGGERFEGLAYAVRYGLAQGRRLGRSRVVPGPFGGASNIRILAHDAEGVSCGYFDLSPFDASETRVLAQSFPTDLRVDPLDREVAVGVFHLDTGPYDFRPFATTRAWCWQQGCRLQWLTDGSDHLALFNDFDGDTPIARIVNSATARQEAQLAAPLYCLSPDRRTGLTLNFGRLERMRPGYGYARARDPFEGQPCPARDGIWKADLVTGKQDLLVSYDDIVSLPGAYPRAGGAHYLNHLEFNSAGTRFLFFHLVVRGKERLGQAAVVNDDGSGLAIVPMLESVSHYCWIDDARILIFAHHALQGRGYYEVDVLTGVAKAVAGMPPVDGHPRASADTRSVITDTYPNAKREQDLILYDLQTRTSTVLASFFTPYAFTKIVRCDLHPRVSPSGRYIAVDTPHLGRRAIAVVELR